MIIQLRQSQERIVYIERDNILYFYEFKSQTYNKEGIEIQFSGHRLEVESSDENWDNLGFPKKIYVEAL